MAIVDISEHAPRQEALIREVNERIREVSAGYDPFEVVCECPRAECRHMLEVSVAEYDEVRLEPSTFLVAPGHEPAGSGQRPAGGPTYRAVGAASPAW